MLRSIFGLAILIFFGSFFFSQEAHVTKVYLETEEISYVADFVYRVKKAEPFVERLRFRIEEVEYNVNSYLLEVTEIISVGNGSSTSNSNWIVQPKVKIPQYDISDSLPKIGSIIRAIDLDSFYDSNPPAGKSFKKVSYTGLADLDSGNDFYFLSNSYKSDLNCFVGHNHHGLVSIEKRSRFQKRNTIKPVSGN